MPSGSRDSSPPWGARPPISKMAAVICARPVTCSLNKAEAVHRLTISRMPLPQCSSAPINTIRPSSAFCQLAGISQATSSKSFLPVWPRHGTRQDPLDVCPPSGDLGQAPVKTLTARRYPGGSTLARLRAAWMSCLPVNISLHVSRPTSRGCWHVSALLTLRASPATLRPSLSRCLTRCLPPSCLRRVGPI